MTKGKSGIFAGLLIAASALQWGVFGLFILALAAFAGYLIERWLWPQREALWAWLRAGKRRLNKEE